MMIKDYLSDAIDLICETFSSDNYTYGMKEPVRRFPSFISAAFRWVVRHWFITIPILWLGVLISCIVAKLSFIGVIIMSIIGTVLAVFLLFIVFLVMMALESIAKHISSLILYHTLADTPENLVDEFVSFLLKGK